MKNILLICCLLILVSCYEPVWAQSTYPMVKATTIEIEDASKHIGNLVKLNCTDYRTADNGKTLSITKNIKRPDRSLTLLLTGKSRKKILAELRSRRELNTEIESPLDTSITAIGKIMLHNGRLYMLVSHASNVYVGADLKVEQP